MLRYYLVGLAVTGVACTGFGWLIFVVVNNHRYRKTTGGGEPRYIEMSFTKVFIIFLVLNAVGWVWCTYILAFLGHSAIAEATTRYVITEILGVFLGYCVKAGLENRNKHRTPDPEDNLNPDG